VRHYVLTRAAYGPRWDIAANRRRLAVSAAVTVPLMAAQTSRDWTWIVLLDERDPLIEERIALFSSGAPALIPLRWMPPQSPRAAPWDRHGAATNTVQRIAAEAYRAPWREALGSRDERILQTRLDDDDGLAPDSLARYREASARLPRRAILMLPKGVRVWRGMYADVRHERNAMHTLLTPPGDTGTVYDYPHAKCDTDRRAGGARVVMVDQRWGWLWVRHRDTISGHKRAESRITSLVRDAFPIDWRGLRAAWR